MSNELHAYATSGLTLYAVLLNSTGQLWNGSAFEAYNGANWTDYDIALTEAGAGIYLGNMPAVAAGSYSYAVYEQAGANPATTDTLRGTGYLEWSGSAVVAQSGDAYARLGAPAGASVSADIAVIDGVADSIKSTVDSGTFGNSALATLIGDVPTNAELGTALAAADDAVLAAIAALNDLSVADIIAGITDGSLDLQEMLRIILAVLAGKSSGSGTSTIVFRDSADTKDRVTATMVAGNRSAVTLDAS